MKLNLSRLVLALGLSLGMVPFASAAEAGITLNGSSLGEQSHQQQLLQQAKATELNGSYLTRQSSRAPQLAQRAEKLSQNASNLTGAKKLSGNGSGLTRQVTGLLPAPTHQGIETSP